jgi:hypothetical protein
MAGTLTISQLSDGTNSTSSTNPIKGSAKAWVNFGYVSSAITVRDSFNVSSVTRNGTGDYTVNFTNTMPSSNYSVITGCSSNSDPTTGGGFSLTIRSPSTNTTTSTRLIAGVSNVAFDLYVCDVAIFSS